MEENVRKGPGSDLEVKKARKKALWNCCISVMGWAACFTPTFPFICVEGAIIFVCRRVQRLIWHSDPLCYVFFINEWQQTFSIAERAPRNGLIENPPSKTFPRSLLEGCRRWLWICAEPVRLWSVIPADPNPGSVAAVEGNAEPSSEGWKGTARILGCNSCPVLWATSNSICAIENELYIYLNWWPKFPP